MGLFRLSREMLLKLLSIVKVVTRQISEQMGRARGNQDSTTGRQGIFAAACF
jgi:hypothetical protein